MSKVQRSIDAELADAIIVEVKTRGLYKGSTPSTDTEKIELAVSLIDQAYGAKKMNSKSDNVNAIINMVENNESVGVRAKKKAAKTPQKKVVAKKSVSVSDFIADQGLPEPEGVHEDVPTLPADFTLLKDVEVRKFHSVFNALSVRAYWLATQEESYMEEAQEMSKTLLTKSMNEVDELDAKGRPRKATVIKEEASRNDEYIEWNNKVVEHRKRYRALRNLAEGYEKKHKALSREWTMRSGE